MDMLDLNVQLIVYGNNIDKHENSSCYHILVIILWEIIRLTDEINLMKNVLFTVKTIMKL